MVKTYRRLIYLGLAFLVKIFLLLVKQKELTLNGVVWFGIGYA